MKSLHWGVGDFCLSLSGLLLCPSLTLATPSLTCAEQVRGGRNGHGPASRRLLICPSSHPPIQRWRVRLGSLLGLAILALVIFHLNVSVLGLVGSLPGKGKSYSSPRH